MEFGKALPYDIVISSSANQGFKVKVGCCESVFSNKEDLKAALAEYIDDPESMEKKYNESNQNNGPDAVEETAPDGDSECRSVGMRGPSVGNRALQSPRH